MNSIEKDRDHGTFDDPVSSGPPLELLQNALELLVENRSIEWIARELGYSEQQLLAAMRYRSRSSQPSSSIRRSRPPVLRTSRRKLEPGMETELRALVVGNMPDKLELDAWLWDKVTVGLLIERHSGIRLPARTLSTYLDRWGFNPTKPVQLVHRSKPTLIREWMKRSYPYMAEQAREENAELFWVGVSNLADQETGWISEQRNADHLSGAYSEQGAGFEMLFIVSNRKQMLWSVHPEPIGTNELLWFIERAAKARSSKLHLLIESSPTFNATTLSGVIDACAEKASITFFDGRFSL